MRRSFILWMSQSLDAGRRGNWRYEQAIDEIRGIVTMSSVEECASGPKYWNVKVGSCHCWECIHLSITLSRTSYDLATVTQNNLLSPLLYRWS